MYFKGHKEKSTDSNFNTLWAIGILRFSPFQLALRQTLTLFWCVYVCVREKENKLMVSASWGRKVIVLYGSFFLLTIQEMSTLITLKKSKHIRSTISMQAGPGYTCLARAPIFNEQSQ